MRAKVGRRRKKDDYARTTVEIAEGHQIFCHSCGCIGEPDVVESNVLGSGRLVRCHGCRSLHFTWMEDMAEAEKMYVSGLKYVQEKML